MSAPQSSTDLHVVDEEAAAAAPQPTEQAEPAPVTPPAEPEPTKNRRGVPLWLLGIVALIGVVAWVSQYQVSQRLEREVTVLGEELAAAGSQLEAYELHLETVRVSVGDLSDRMGNLKALVALDPTTIVDIPPSEGFVAPSDALAAPINPVAEEAAPVSSEEIIGGALSMPLDGALDGEGVGSGGDPFGDDAMGLPGYSEPVPWQGRIEDF